MRFLGLGRVAGWGLLLVAALAALGALPAQSGNGTAADEAAIRDVFDKQTAAWNRGDTAAFMEGYWKSPETEFVGAGGILRGVGRGFGALPKGLSGCKGDGAFEFQQDGSADAFGGGGVRDRGVSVGPGEGTVDGSLYRDREEIAGGLAGDPRSHDGVSDGGSGREDGLENFGDNGRRVGVGRLIPKTKNAIGVG